MSYKPQNKSLVLYYILLINELNAMFGVNVFEHSEKILLNSICFVLIQLSYVCNKTNYNTIKHY